MLKTDQGRKIGITENVGKSVGQETVVVRKHPQYLEVALEKSKKDTEIKTDQKVKRTSTNRDVRKQRRINYIQVERDGSTHISETSTVDAKSQKNISKARELEKRDKGGKAGIQPKKSGNTLNDEKWFENKENQKLYEELDLMLAGGQSLQKVGSRKTPVKKAEKTEKKAEIRSNPVKVVFANKKLPQPAKPEVVLEYKREPLDRHSRLNPHGFFGPEGTKVLKESEARVRESLEELDKLDNFEFGDFSSRSKKQEALRRAKFAEYAERSSHNPPQHITGTVTSRNHIVADIPIYLPSLGNTGNAGIPVFNTVQPAVVDNLNSHVPGMKTDPLDTYRNHANPVSERILLERAEKERLQLEKETLKYFDTDQGEDPDLVPALGPISEKLRKVKSGNNKKKAAIRSAPQPNGNPRNTSEIKADQKAYMPRNSHSAERRKTPESNDLTHRSRNTYPGITAAENQREGSYGKLKYSPEGFQAHLERKARLEKEARILSKAEAIKSKWDIEDEALAKQGHYKPIESSELSFAMDTARRKDFQTYQYHGSKNQKGYDDADNKTIRLLPDEKQGDDFHAQQYSGPVTYRVPKQTQAKDYNENDRGIDQDRYSDRNVNSYRESGKIVPKIPRQQSEEKVEYILRTKSSDSKLSSHVNMNKGLHREDTSDAAIKVKMAREGSFGSRKQKDHRLERKHNSKYDEQLRYAPDDNETRRALAAEVIASARQEAAEVKKVQENQELNKYFMEPERRDSKSNVIPFYSDSKSYYSKQNIEIQEKQMKSEVEETSYRKSVEKPKETVHVAVRPETVDTGVNTEPLMGEKQTSINNMISTVKSPRKEYEQEVGEPKTTTQNKTEFPMGTEPATSKSVPTKSSKLTREKTRENTRDKLTRQKTKEKTMDSQGPTSDAKLNLEDLETAGFLDMDEIEEGLDGNEIYVCYLVTDDGAAIGPLRLDIEDIQIGLPKVGESDIGNNVGEPDIGNNVGEPDIGNNVDTQEPEKRENKAEEGMRNRQTGSHGLNEFSSRSHSMLMLTIDSEMQDPDDENLFITKRGKLTFVDLAGSEKVKDSNSTAETLVESNNINRSLLILGNCISSLGDPKRRQGHIPYRDSKLTKLLADSLGGNGVTLMICCITPSSHHASETMNTLRYASRAKKIRTKPVIKMDPREKLILSLKKEIKVLRNENHYLRQQLEFPAKPKGQLQKENDQQFVKIMKDANGKLPSPNNTAPPPEKLAQNGAKDESGLYEMLQEYMVENETLRSENSEMQVARDKQRQEQQLLYRDNEKLMKRVDELERRVNHAQSSWQAMPRQGSDPMRSRDHSPTRGSPQYMGGPGNGGRQGSNRLPPPPDLPLRDPVYTGSPHQGYNSPTGSGNKGRQPNRNQPMKPPHRLNEPLQQQRPVHEQNGPYMNGHPSPAQYRQNPGSPNRSNVDMRMDSRRSSQSTSSDAIRDMNEKLKQELAQLEGQIHQHTAVNSRNRNIYGSQGSIR